MYRSGDKITYFYPLSFVEPGEEVEICEIRGGIGLCKRLAYMGIYPGTHLRVISNGRPGPVIVGIGGKRIGLGFGMCNKIMVRALN